MAQDNDQNVLERIDIPTFIVGLIAGFLAFNNEPWWTLTSPTNSHILLIQASPFYLQISAIGLPSTITTATTLGAATRIITILCSLALLASSLRLNQWWRPLVGWLSLAGLVEIFFSLFLLIHAGQTALLTAYGPNPPTIGTITYPAKIIGNDLTVYTSPSLSAGFNVDFYLGVVSLTVVGVGIVLKMLQEKGISSLPDIRELFLTPPYQQVWLSSSDQALNPLSRDPEDSSDAQLLESFGRIYNTLQPGGTISIILPSRATNINDRFQKLLTWTGFSVERAESIHQALGNPVTYLLFKKSGRPQEVVVAGAESETVSPGLADIGPSASETLPQLAVIPQPRWTHGKISRAEKTMLRSAVSILSKSKEPMPYHELLNEVYMEMVEKRVEFDSARQIETALLKHTGVELVLIEETDEQALKTVKKWALAEDEPNRDRREPSARRIPLPHPRVPAVTALLRKWQRKPRYRPKPETDE